MGLFAQTEPTITQLTVNDGLSQGMIFDILQTRDGFIWIATKDGLNRYDGSRFEVFSPNPYDPYAIVGSEMWDLFEDSRVGCGLACQRVQMFTILRQVSFFTLSIKINPSLPFL
ncbi:MAG: hypothetical protein IPH36_10965 [Saprospiraceae bacterium]|nr:hypothetical protein [Saprospiraceae bacterium]